LRVVFFNKADLGEAGAREARDPGAIVGSSWDPALRAALCEAIARLGWGGDLPDLERPHLAAVREFAAVNEALEALTLARKTLLSGEPSDFIAGELARAFSALGHVSERTAAEEVLDGIFARFCIGK
jgi:tRNA U34 5-carboxymethylaminomethyl modifying GTPase MnmE/TrmE